MYQNSGSLFCCFSITLTIRPCVAHPITQIMSCGASAATKNILICYQKPRLPFLFHLLQTMTAMAIHNNSAVYLNLQNNRKLIKGQWMDSGWRRQMVRKEGWRRSLCQPGIILKGWGLVRQCNSTYQPPVVPSWHHFPIHFTPICTLHHDSPMTAIWSQPPSCDINVWATQMTCSSPPAS